MFKFLRGVVAGSGSGVKDLPYNIGVPYSSAWGSWTHHRGTSKEDGSPVSIFSLSGSSAQDGHLAAGRNGVKRLRTVRHPNILSFLNSTEVEIVDGAMTKVTVYMVTEPVMPLSENIKELGLDGKQRDEYYAWGLHQIAKAVSFLNNDCKLVHANVCLASVVVTQTLDWKLHAFDVLSEFDGTTEASGGTMLALLPDYQRLLSSMPSKRMNTSKLIENSEYFQNKLVDTIQFMEVLSLKDSVEKDNFFRKLPNLAEQLPRPIVLKKILPLLASALEFGSAAAPALIALLKMGSWLPTEEFSVKVLPIVVKLFSSNDRAIRVALLQHIDQFGDSLSAQVVDEQVYPHVANGFSDASAFLRELTLKSMLVLAPKLSQRTISASLLKYLSKLQVDEEPAIRTNTTILLGNISSYLNEGTRKRVLINAFTVRALRDTFSPARGAGIMALCATSSYYDVTEMATRVLPCVVVLTVDPDSDVRSKAFQAVDQFLQIVRQYHEKGGTGQTSVNTTTGISGNSSLLGWAMSNLTLVGKTHEQAAVASIGSATGIASTTADNHSAVDIASTSTTPALIRTVPSMDSVDQPVPGSPSSTDGWGELDNGIHEEQDAEKEGWDDLEPLEEPQPSPSLANIQAAQKRPVSQPIPPASHVKAPVTDFQARPTTTKRKDDDEDLWGSVAAPPPRTAHRANTAISRANSAGISKARDDDDPWAAIAAPPPTTTVRPLAAGRGRGSRAAAPRLGAQRINRSSGS
ncbi:hypothetical protein Droror1_Dr00008395 [Drosera rotundifolia]